MEEEIRLSKLVLGGDEQAIAALALANLRLVVTIALNIGLVDQNAMDAISEGNIGLMRAAAKYDYRHGVKFSTYAAFWIKQRVFRYLSNASRTIRIPVHMCGKYALIAKISGDMEESLGRPPTPEEIEETTGISAKNLFKHGYKGVGQPMISLDAPSSRHSDQQRSTIGDEIADPRSVESSSQVQSADDNLAIAELLSRFDERTQDIIRRRYGIGYDPQTLEEVGRVYGVTRERIRQIQVIAEHSMRYHMEVQDSRAIAGFKPDLFPKGAARVARMNMRSMRSKKSSAQPEKDCHPAAKSRQSS